MGRTRAPTTPGLQVSNHAEGVIQRSDLIRAAVAANTETRITISPVSRKPGAVHQRAHQMIEAAAVSTIVDTAPSNEAQARELAPLKDDPEAVRAVWKEVKQEHGDKVKASDVREAVGRTTGRARGLCRTCAKPSDELVGKLCPDCIAQKRLSDRRESERMTRVQNDKNRRRFVSLKKSWEECKGADPDAMARAIGPDEAASALKTVRALRRWLDDVEPALAAAEAKSTKRDTR